MTAALCPPISAAFEQASEFKEFFGKDAGTAIRRLETREQPIPGVPGASCKTDLFFGFFFDGTKNNYVKAESGRNHSNVARLYDCFPGLSVPGVLPNTTDWQYKPENFTHFFRVYIPGVASPFKEINDTGDGLELTAGGAAGHLGETRILWALIQAINNVHRYFLKAPLVSADEIRFLMTRMDLSASSRRAMKPRSNSDSVAALERENRRTRSEFEKILLRLHSAVSQHWPDKSTGRAKKTDPGIVQTIYVSVFGFSRGATQARAFTNWLIELCRLDARLSGRRDELSLGGFKLQIEFLGLFDTVASVGAGNTFSNSWLLRGLDGHGAWADNEESLRIPEGIRCVHLVSAHEVRRSFPLDSIAVGNVMPLNADEVVFPGVHSDLGSGYSPLEQGRGVDPMGADMLTRVPLLYMYKEARAAGVPLKLEHASDTSKLRFAIKAGTIAALNGYLSAALIKKGSLTAIMREQAKLHIQWRLARRVGSKASLEMTGSFQRATNFDRNDLHSANHEFEAEIAAFESWLSKKGKGFRPTEQPPGFGNQHEREWEEIATWWNNAAALPQDVLTFFDEYVHDSRAWFKLSSEFPDNEVEFHARLKKWLKMRVAGQELNTREEQRFNERSREMTLFGLKKRDANSPKYVAISDGLTLAQRNAADDYARTGKIPRMLTEGREPYEWKGVAIRAGYLRFRKIYGGRDSVLIS